MFILLSPAGRAIKNTVIPSEVSEANEVEGPLLFTLRRDQPLPKKVPRLRFAPLGMTGPV